MDVDSGGRRFARRIGIATVGLFALFAAVGLSAGSLSAAPAGQAAPARPLGVIKVVAVAANPDDPFAINSMLPDGKTKINVGTTGLDNVSVGVPVVLQATTAQPGVQVDKYAWTLLPPARSKAQLSGRDTQVVQFTPDVTGAYKVDVVLTNEAGAGPMATLQLRAGEYIGVEAGNCADCHPKQTEEWAETGHARIFREEINGLPDPASSHYGQRCIRCHTTGYYPGAQNGGFAAVQEATGWQFPALETIQAGANTWNAMPRALRNLATIGCENCHGPAKEHVTQGARMAKSLESGVCNQCHNGGGTHIKGTEVKYAKHFEEGSTAWSYPTGPARQACVRCHSGEGYATFIANPGEPATWNNTAGTLQCASCHDPHSDKNSFQLRVVGKPVETVGLTKDFGLSATCVECHNGRVPPDAAPGGSTPHYSAAGEMLADAAGVTYGQEVPNSPHGRVVGSAPVKDPRDTSGQTMLFGGVAPGPCVTCHMWPTIPANAPEAAYRFQVGEHSFNTISPDGSLQYLAACQTCHPGKKSLAEFVAGADYDGNGRAEPVQTEILNLLQVLRGAIASAGVKPVDGHPYFDAADTARADSKVKSAIYNYLLVRGLEGMDGKAAAVHNFRRSVALLQLSYRDVTGRDVPRATFIAATPTPRPAPTATPTGAATPPAAQGTPATAEAPPTVGQVVAPGAQPATAAVAKLIPHSLAGRDQCSMCHTTGNVAMPANHIGRNDASCTACHRQA